MKGRPEIAQSVEKTNNFFGKDKLFLTKCLDSKCTAYNN